jgi:hypothetical protein
MAGRFRVEHYSSLRGGEKVRTVTREGHRVRIAFPPGRRTKGSGRVLEVLHPLQENPCRLPNPAELVVMMANPSEISESRSERHGLQGASEMCEDFRGEPCRDVDTYVEPEPRPASLAQLGTLVELQIKRPGGWKWGELDFTGKDVNVAAIPQGTQIYFIGGDQKITRGQLTHLGVDNSKELIDLGEAMLIAYRATKMHVNGIASDYEHKFGERTDRRPRLMYDKRGPQPRIFLVGGEYVANIEGIDN